MDVKHSPKLSWGICKFKMLHELLSIAAASDFPVMSTTPSSGLQADEHFFWSVTKQPVKQYHRVISSKVEKYKYCL